MRYTVKDTHIRHGNKTYGPDSIIELSEEEAVPLLHHLESVVGTETESDDDGEDSGEDRKRRKK